MTDTATEASSLTERVEKCREAARTAAFNGLHVSRPVAERYAILDRLIALERAEAAWETASEWECACGQHERDVRIVAAEEALEAACAAIEGRSR